MAGILRFDHVINDVLPGECFPLLQQYDDFLTNTNIMLLIIVNTILIGDYNVV